MDIPYKTCVACGSSYTPKHPLKQKYCSHECGNIHRRNTSYKHRKDNNLCLWCGKVKINESTWTCSVCRARYLEQGLKGNWRRAQLKHKYNLSLEDFNTMLLSQNGVCVICGGVNKGKLTDVPLSVDHNHTTGQVRGLLCSPCNSKLGWFESNKEALLSYTNRGV